MFNLNNVLTKLNQITNCKLNKIHKISCTMSKPEGKRKYNGIVKKPKWEERINTDDDTAKKARLDFERVKKRKFAMLLAYSGADYYGMQRNPGMRTIEEDLITAMLKSKLITEEASNQIQSIQFQRAARTDKGVSAARQVVSLKLPEHSTPELLNEHLPEQIRVFAITRVTKGFNSKTQCDARSYDYVLPTFSFTSNLSVEEAVKFRVTEDVIQKVNETLSLFCGTKNFHNFTSRKNFKDPSANRFIISFECGKPFVQDDLEFAVISVKGQSFMLHQIRKMIGLMLAVVQGLTTTATIEQSWTEDRIDIPMAPGLGLVLNQVHYDRYNERYSTDGLHEALRWVELDDEIEKFKHKFIYPNIVKTELNEKSMFEWLQTLPMHSYSVRDDSIKKTDDGNNSDDENDIKKNDGNNSDDENDIKKEENKD